MRPFHDLQAAYRAQEREIRQAVLRVLESGRYLLADELAAFESEFAAAVGVGHAVGVSSGTDALVLALRALDIGPEDEVVVPALTAAPTAMAVCAAGARLVLADVDAETLTLDPDALAEALSPRTRAVIPVHLYGQCADMDALARVCAGRPVALIEDAAQAHGATDRGRPAGGMGRVAAFSFYPTKNLGALGDAGAVVTDDATLGARVRRLRTYGAVDDDFVEPGFNARMDELQAAVLRVRLAHLADASAARRRHAARYRDELRNPHVALPIERDGAVHVYHQFVVRCTARDALAAHLGAHGLATLVHYPRPLHAMTAFASGRARWAREPAQAALASGEVLSLPIQPELGPEHQAEVITAVNAFRP
ncbi:MAG: DegT/DnrJ/EryC1/StrS family aminotransferase [Planctomycetota bacterium]|jgi:dTDP-4-amino-4,6-dideoxygalactose transaminase